MKNKNFKRQDGTYRAVIVNYNPRKDIFDLFLKKTIPDDIFGNYLTDKDGTFTFIMQQFIIDNMKDELISWCTGIGIIDACELLFNSAIENGNIKQLED